MHISATDWRNMRLKPAEEKMKATVELKSSAWLPTQFKASGFHGGKILNEVEEE